MPPKKQLKNLDLNLLVALDALLETRSVTGAAKKLGRSQSAMSHALGRLREQLDDPVLVRVGHRMEPTSRARDLAEPLRAAMQTIAQLVEPPQVFDPAEATGTVTILTSDYVSLVLLQELYVRIRERAPGVDLVVRKIDQTWPKRIEEGETQIALTPIMPELQDRYRVEEVFSDRFVTLAHPDWLSDDGTLTLEAFLERPHVLVSPEGNPGSTVQTALSPLGRTRRIGLDMPFFLGAVDIAVACDEFITLPERMVPRIIRAPYVAVEPAMYMVPYYVRQVWHMRNDKDPATTWLRAQIKAVGDSLVPGPHVPPGTTATTPA